MGMVQLLFFTLIFSTFGPLLAEPNATPGFATHFQTGIESYQKKDYAAAKTSFEAAVQERPQEVSALTNLALTHYRLGQRGWALGYARQVLLLEPGHDEAAQLKNAILEEGQIRDIPHRIEMWEIFHRDVFSVAPGFVFVGLALMIFLSGMWSWLSFLGARKRALQNETAAPGFPFLPMIFSLLFLTALALAISKKKDERELRGTIVIERVSALTAPSEQSPSLFELNEGLEVVIRKVEGSWLQVTYPGASTGWIPAASVMIAKP